MSIGSFLKSLVPFASRAASDVDAEIAAIQSKANADIAAATLKHTQAAATATVQAKQGTWKQFQADYAAYLASIGQSVPSAAPTGSTGPSGA